MKHKIKLYIILFFIQTLSCAFAQQMSVTTLPLNNYLPSSTILRVHCDREGFLWFASPVSSHLIARLEVTTNEDEEPHFRKLELGELEQELSGKKEPEEAGQKEA